MISAGVCMESDISKAHLNYCRLTHFGWVKICSGNGLLPDDTKPQPTSDFSLVRLNGLNLRDISRAANLYNEFEHYAFKITATFPRHQ